MAPHRWGRIAINPQHAKGGSWEHAMLSEDFPAAWAIADAVLRARDPATRDDPASPYHERWVWDGSSLAGRRVVVRCYHGLGDTLQFARYLPHLRAIADHVTLEVQPELLPLLAASPGVDVAIPFDPAAPIPATATVDVEIMELQHALRLAPTGGPYLTVQPASTVAPTGVCWQAGGWDPARTIPLSLLRRVLPADAVSLCPGAPGLPDPLGGAMDMRRTAALVASLRRVITVDTMIAHLAGALGRPVHLLLRADADWRWGRGQRSAWYRSARIHRQQRPGDWEPALDSLATALTAEG